MLASPSFPVRRICRQPDASGKGLATLAAFAYGAVVERAVVATEG